MPKRPSHLIAAAVLLATGISFLLIASMFRYVDLKPKVEENFFFSRNDPEFRADKKIAEIFPQPPQLLMSAKGDMHSEAYLKRMAWLSDELAKLPEVLSVQSLTHGPDSLKDALESPLWQRILGAEHNESSLITIFVQDVPPEALVKEIEEIGDGYHQPDFQLMISGAPYITELISRYLLQDLKAFTAAAFVVFGVILFLIFRSLRILFGTLLASVDSSAITLIITHGLKIPIGPLTANLSTIVFVLTLSHIVFFTFNWTYVMKGDHGPTRHPVFLAARLTFPGSFWSMATTLLGFVSLFLVKANPLRQLGIAGAIGTLIAFSVAYLAYPLFLLLETSSRAKKASAPVPEGPENPRSFIARRHPVIFWVIVAMTAIAGFGVPRFNTDPSLLSYFKKGSELREGLDYIDRHGGSSPLKIVVTHPDPAVKFDTGEAYEKLWRLHQDLEGDPAVGNVVSLPLILAEAKRSPLSHFFSTRRLLKIMESPKYGEIARYFVNADRSKAFFLLRLKENGREEPRLKIIERIKGIVTGRHFIPVLVGGAYLLQARMSELISSSLFSGIGMLLALFGVMAWGISRSLRVSAATVLSLAVIPVCMLGLIGFLKVPLDIISSPAANIAIGMGVDAMVHTLSHVRRYSRREKGVWRPWFLALSHLWKPILFSMTVVCAGFGIFTLSSFPPTQRFGLSVVLGSMLSPIATLFVLPWVVTAGKR